MSETPPRLPAEQFLARFPVLRKAATDEDLKTENSRSIVREFFRHSLREHTNYWYAYRYKSTEFDIERDLLENLDAYAPVGKFDNYTAAVAIHDLKLLRRLALQRYAFGLAGEIANRLATMHVRRPWLYKDRLLPRIPLALAVGYGVVLGAFKDWLTILGPSAGFTVALTVFNLALSWFLIYCNVRDRIGNRREVSKRAWHVFAISLAWNGATIAAGRALASLDAGLTRSFNWGSAISIGSSALLVAIVVQFFFAKAGSIADPL